MSNRMAPNVPGRFKPDDPRQNELDALRSGFTSLGGGRRGADRGEPQTITPGSGFSRYGRDFGLGDLADRKRMAGNLQGLGFDDVTGVLGPKLGVGQPDKMLAAVNQIAEEQGVTPFASLDEIPMWFVERIEEMAGVRSR